MRTLMAGTGGHLGNVGQDVYARRHPPADPIIGAMRQDIEKGPEGGRTSLTVIS